MHRSHSLMRMVSTRGGMRRILKKRPPVHTYIRQAVESGTYYPDPPPYYGVGERPPRPDINKYPKTYEILTLNPPIPVPGRIPKKMRALRSKSELPTDKLMTKYLRRYQEEAQGGPVSAEDYYRRLLGVKPPKSYSAMGQKSVLLNKAYVFALKQFEVMRDHDVTEEESLGIVESLLQKEDVNERHASRRHAKAVAEWRASNKPAEKETAKVPPASTIAESETFVADEYEDDMSVPSVLHSKPRTIEGMHMWSQRLRAVSYNEWTVGASVALDHWIAVSVLNLTEETWEELLQGNNPALTSRGRDIITVRRSLFPETVIHEGGFIPETDADLKEPPSSRDRSIDELLASLGGFDTREAKKYWKSEPEHNRDRDSDVVTLMDQLQDWRAKNVEVPYENWSREDKDEFMDWINDYVAQLTTASDGEVDLDATREALLSSPPLDRDSSDTFWKNIEDEAEAEIFLHSILKAGPLEESPLETSAERNAREAYATFWNLPYSVQLQKLVDLGTLRPLYDEFTSDSDRVAFMVRHAEKLVEGLELEHLVPDSDGPVSGAELGKWGEENGLSKEDRFRIAVLPYGNDEFGSAGSERSRALFLAWNEQKAGRARYEEFRFKRGKLGLRYPDRKKIDKKK